MATSFTSDYAAEIEVALEEMGTWRRDFSGILRAA
jgi:hypothetical protein